MPGKEGEGNPQSPDVEGEASDCDIGAGGPSDLFATPEKTFETIKKGLVNRDPDLVWEGLSQRMVGIFEEGRKELISKPLAERKDIAAEGMVAVEDLEKFDTKSFFEFYFNYKKHEVYRMNSAELLERKVDAVRNATVTSVTFDPAPPAQPTKAFVHYEMSGEAFVMPMVREGTEWQLDSMEETEAKAAGGE